MALLALLGVRGEARRDEIVDLIWRDVDEAKARNAFRQALHRLRSALGDAIIPQDREVLRLVPGDGLTIDLREFEAAIAAGRLDQALQLYQGDFLQDAILDEPAFDQWAEQERTRIRARYRVALEQVIAQAQAAGRWNDAITGARRLCEVAPLDEQAARTAAQTYVSAGRRTEARDALVHFGARLQAELGLPMPAELRSMLERLDRLSHAAPSVQRSQAGSLPTLAFAGREPELSRLLALWRSTGEDAGTIALIAGDAGIGKTRLVSELAIHARSLGRATILQAREYPSTAQVPFALIAEALRPLVRAPGVVGASRHLLAEASRLLPELRDVVELPPLSPIEDEAARVRFFEGVAALVDAAAYEHPLMVVLEDLQHSAPSTLDLVAYLASRLAGSAVMFVLTVRTPAAFVAGRVRRMIESRNDPLRARWLHISLSPLDDAAARAAIEPHAEHLAEPVRARIVSRAGGNPGQLMDFLRRAMQGDELALPPVPYRAVLQDRIESLSASHRRALLTLAILGRPASASALASMAHFPAGAAEESIDALVAEGLLRRLAGEVEPEPLAAEVILESSADSSRAFLAAWIADALATDPSANPAELARLHAAAGRTRETWDTARRAALRAMQLGAWPEAVQYLQLARSVAGEPAQVAEAEALLSALGAGKPRLAGIAEPAAPGMSATSPPGELSSAWQRWFPNWRILFGAALATLAISAYVLARAPARGIRAVNADTLQLSEGEGGRLMRFATGDPVSGFTLSDPVERRGAETSWGDSVTRWRPEVVAARGRALDGSPDGRWVLVAIPRSPATSGQDLVSVQLHGPARVALDTASHRSVVEAAWSPDGSRIAWVARVGPERQQEIFVSFTDGTHVENVTRHPADDYHLAWSGDGGLLGFTSLRDGNAELYAFGVMERRLWRLTRNEGQDDWARFSRSGRFVAFESTRDGETGVYVMPALGGGAVRVDGGVALSVLAWRGGPARYLDHVGLDPEAHGQDTVRLRLVGLDQRDNPLTVPHADIELLDTTAARLGFLPDSTPVLIGRRAGVVRVIASAGGWRVDTALVRVGTAAVTFLDGIPEAKDWRMLGAPSPAFGAAGARINADDSGESGMLSRVVAPLIPGLELSALVDDVPGALLSRASAGIALVAPEQPEVLDSVAPQFLRHASATWDADARRWVYAVGREVHTEPSRPSRDSMPLLLRLRVEADSTVSFHVGNELRWRSTVRVIGRSAPRVQGWIGGRSTGALRVTRARYLLDVASSP